MDLAIPVPAAAPLLAIVEPALVSAPMDLRRRRSARSRRLRLPTASRFLTVREADLLRRHETRLRRAAAVGAAVWMGANTVRRLAREWGTTDAWAETHLRDAERRGHVHQLAGGRYVGHMTQTP